jgi:hypothetical protein
MDSPSPNPNDVARWWQVITLGSILLARWQLRLSSLGEAQHR